MKRYRLTDTGRIITAKARLRDAPDLDRLVALVLHLADELHADLRTQQLTCDAPDDLFGGHPATEGDDDDKPRTTP